MVKFTCAVSITDKRTTENIRLTVALAVSGTKHRVVAKKRKCTKNTLTMSEYLSRIISVFTVSVDKHFDERRTPLFNRPRLLYFCALRAHESPRAPSALSAAL